MQLDSNPHLLTAKLKHPTIHWAIGELWLISFRLVIVPSRAQFLRRFTKTDERSLNIHMSRVNFDKQ